MSENLQQLSDGWADLVERSAESVVSVDARRRFPASGIAWSQNLIVTAHHVVEVEDEIAVGLADGSQISASLLGRDPRSDLAVLKVEAELSPADWAERDQLRVGQIALALGRPGPRVKASQGIISGLLRPGDMKRRREKAKTVMRGAMKDRRRRRRLRAEWRGGDWMRGKWALALAEQLIETDMTLYPGFSGGPLLGADGKAHGMNTSGFGRGISMALPVAVIRRSVNALLADGSIQQGYLGIGIQEARLPNTVAEALDQEQGLLIVSIEGDSPAAEAGLLVGDILTGLADQALEAVDDLQLLLTRLEIGSAVPLEFARGGVIQQGEITVGVSA